MGRATHLEDEHTNLVPSKVFQSCVSESSGPDHNTIHEGKDVTFSSTLLMRLLLAKIQGKYLQLDCCYGSPEPPTTPFSVSFSLSLESEYYSLDF